MVAKEGSGYSNNLFINDGAGKFSDHAATAGVADTEGNGNSVLFFDLDQDGACVRVRRTPKVSHSPSVLLSIVIFSPLPP